MAVQNSELLRHTSLSLLSVLMTGDHSGTFGTYSGTSGSGVGLIGSDGGHSGTSGSGVGLIGTGGQDGGKRTSLLKLLAGKLKELKEEVLRSRLRLEWSHDFHRNHLFGQSIIIQKDILWKAL